MKKVLTLAVAAALAGGAAMSHAYEPGDWILRVGATTVAPDADSEEVPGLGVTVDVDDNTQLGIIPRNSKVSLTSRSWHRPLARPDMARTRIIPISGSLRRPTRTSKH